MLHVIKRTLVFLVAITDVLVVGQDCVYQSCVCAGPAIVCEAQGMDSVPPLVGRVTGYNTLNMAVNDITRLPAHSLPTNLTGLYLAVNPIEVIHPAALDESASTLKELTFSFIAFTRIPDAFGHLKVLQSLMIQFGNISDWNEPAMKMIGPTLQSLELDNVGMTSWPAWFQYFPKVTQLLLTSGQIASIPDDALNQVKDKLTSLSLANNSLTFVPRALSVLSSLTTLDLHQNKLTNLTWLPRLSPVSTLYLDNNRISDATHLGDSLIFYKTQLTALGMTQNKLTTFPNLTFLTQITHLDFSSNLISNPVLGIVPPQTYTTDASYNLLPAVPRIFATSSFITEMPLTHNAIRQLYETDFPASVLIVRLGYNQIMQLTDQSFPPNCTIQLLLLNNNPLSLISEMALRNLVSLTELHLENTQLSYLPQALRHLPRLYLIDISGNSHLVCTCLDKSLESWVLALPHGGFLGTCGLISVNDFFIQFTPMCPDP